MSYIASITSGLQLADDGIWYSAESRDISYPEGGHSTSYQVEDRSFWFRHRNQCIIALVWAMPPAGEGPIFDVGGGNGFVCRGLIDSGFDAVLVEPGPTGCSNARSRGIDSVICATTDSAGFTPNSLPAVGLFDVVEHIEDDLSFLRSMRELLVEGGMLYATVPAYSLLWSEEDVSAGHYRRYTLGGFNELLEKAGFEPQFGSYIFRFLPLPLLLLRALPHRLGMKRNKSAAPEKASRDHATGDGKLSSLLDRLLAAEVDNLNRGKPMRFGGSCLVAARVAPGK